MDKLKGRLKAIIFDMDGTIIDSEANWRNAILHYINMQAPHKTAAEQYAIFDRVTGAGIVEIASSIKTDLALKIRIHDIVKDIRALAVKHLAIGVEYLPGFLDFHANLSKHQFKSGIATNSDNNTFAVVIKHLNLSALFGENLYSIDCIGGVAKPNPAIFLHTAKQLGVVPDECVVFEDSIFGLQAAKAAGMRCVAIKNAKNSGALHLAGAAIDHYDQAVEALHQVFIP